MISITLGNYPSSEDALIVVAINSHWLRFCDRKIILQRISSEQGMICEGKEKQKERKDLEPQWTEILLQKDKKHMSLHEFQIWPKYLYENSAKSNMEVQIIYVVWKL